MNIDEFRKRTEKFLVARDIEDYHRCYEPAYMACNVSKDDFCSILKDETTRKVIAELSAEIQRRKRGEEEIAMSSRKRECALHIKEEQLEHAKQALSLISSNCDRALSSLAKLSFAAGVAATH